MRYFGYRLPAFATMVQGRYLTCGRGLNQPRWWDDLDGYSGWRFGCLDGQLLGAGAGDPAYDPQTYAGLLHGSVLGQG